MPMGLGGSDSGPVSPVALGPETAGTGARKSTTPSATSTGTARAPSTRRRSGKRIPGLVDGGAYLIQGQLPVALHGDRAGVQVHPHAAYPRQSGQFLAHRLHAVPAGH